MADGLAVGRARSLNPADISTSSGRALSAAPEIAPPRLRRASVPAPVMVLTPTNRGGQHLMLSPHVHFAPSPANAIAEVTPYARVYGVHPAFFDFDQNGAMQPTQAGVYEMKRGTLRALTPSCKGRMALVVQGGSSPSNSSGVSSPVCISPMGRWSLSPARKQFQADMPFTVGEQLLVLTDDGQAWMDAVVAAVFPKDCEAEGYSIPGGTVKVSYELGIKWVMPQNISSTLKKKALPAPNFGGFVPPQRPGAPAGPPLPGGGCVWHMIPGQVHFHGGQWS